MNSGLEIPIMSEDKFSKFKNYFKNTPYEEQMNGLEIIFCKETFPNVLCLVCHGSPRYFQMKADLIKKVAESILIDEVISPSEEELCREIKEQLNGTSQVRLDIDPSAKEKVLAIVHRQPFFKDCFEVPPLRKGYQSYAVNHTYTGNQAKV